MKKILNIVLKVVLSLILVMTILGTLGVFPQPTADLYNTPKAFEFIKILIEVQYINVMISIIFVIALISLWTKRTTLATLLILPITVNIVAFHLFLDGGLFTKGAIVADLLLLINIYFLWHEREHYVSLINN